ncbi:helix-turn-helix domain-containing protein [Flavobacterium sp. NST-5]|uniref:Helix-turn-helix domain-containing protein n=1 Tax=Flavobacterium ichthyis TaxID=2698827 RepID=A0ABW9ZAH4_9FLAO|nr:helix-turn-helix domain-containing protein [Flavobacterium ichthyis]
MNLEYNIRANIIKLRKTSKISQEQMADELNMSQSQYSKIEKGT